MEIEQGDYKIHDYDANSNQEKVKRKSKRKDKRDLDSDDDNNSCDNCVPSAVWDEGYTYKTIYPFSNKVYTITLPVVTPQYI